FGATLPLAARVAAVGRPGAGTGAVFAFNTLGAVLGAATSLPLLVPLLGLDGVHQAGATVLAALGLALGVVSGGRRARWGLVGLSLVALLGPLVVPVSWDPRELSAGAFRMRERKADTREAFRARLHRSELLFHADGPDATVAVLGREGERVLTVNGKPDASTRGDMVTQVTSAHVPLILHGDPKTALVVGLGSGVTVGSALHHPGLVVDVVEVSRAVVDASRLFDHISGAPLDDPRVHLSVDDVRSDLRRRPEARWDVIVSEPSNPWVAGNAGLFSVEFFSLLARHLSPEGVAAQWVQRYETDDASLKMVIRSFAQAFAHVEVWQLYPTDLLLVGRQSAPRADLPRMQQRAQTPTIAADLERVGLPGLHGLLSLQAMSAAGVADLLAPPGPVHTDDHPRLEFEGPRRLYAGARSSLIAEHDVRVGRSQPGTWRMPLLGPPPVGVLEQLFVFHTTYPGAPPAWRLGFVPRLVSESDRAFLVDLLFTLAEEARWAQVAPVADRLLSIAPDDPRALYVVARARHAHLVAMGTDSGSPQWSAIAALVARCIDLGDEPRRRCARLSGRL
ncbi:MAG: hypothetical protein QF464_03495, partial [Myxococcota bacterium]|nr:hypothetical protein [Myxococcota bacterium]